MTSYGSVYGHMHGFIFGLRVVSRTSTYRYHAPHRTPPPLAVQFNGTQMKTATIVVGDIHGDLNQLIYPLSEFLSNPARYKLVLLGDYIDRGESNVYIYEIVSRIAKHPNVHALTGNHEMYDKGTIDYFAYRTVGSARCNSFIKTYVYDLFARLNLDITYYDRQTGILYSHSPLNRPLKMIERLPRSIDSVFTYDTDSKNMEYKNIHGHDHKKSPNSDIHKFFTTKEVNMISIDNDASYGTEMLTNIFTAGNNDWTKGVGSKVLYLVIPDDDISKYRAVSKRVPYKSDGDFNCMSFDVIRNALMKASNDRNLEVLFKNMTLANTWNYFKACGDVTIAELPEELKDRYQKLVTSYCSGGRANVYFHDLPWEFYKYATQGESIPSKKLISIVKAGWMPVHDIYWNHCLSGIDGGGKGNMVAGGGNVNGLTSGLGSGITSGSIPESFYLSGGGDTLWSGNVIIAIALILTLGVIAMITIQVIINGNGCGRKVVNGDDM